MGDRTTAVEGIGGKDGVQSVVNRIYQNQRNGVFDHVSKNRNCLETKYFSKRSYEKHYIGVFVIQKVEQ